MARNAETHDALVGQNIDRYVIKRRLGKGGMGSVYYAEHAVIGSRVAVKVLHAQYASRKDIVDRFFTEAQTVNRIRHDNIVQIIDLATLPDGRPYLIMEYLQGKSLKAEIRKKGQLPEDYIREVAAQVADALGAAHSMDVVHRDLKPDNIFLTLGSRGEVKVKVLDFGIAKLIGAEVATGITQSGQVIGTPVYMAPEQAAGRIQQIDHRSDVYSLGIILYEMVCGRVPFNAPAFGDLIIQHVTEAPDPPSTWRPDVDPDLEAIIMRCLEKKRTNRWQGMPLLADALRATSAMPGTRAAPPAPRAVRPAHAPTVPGQDVTEVDTLVPISGEGDPVTSEVEQEEEPPSAGTITGGGAELVSVPPRPRRRRWLPAVIGLVVLAGSIAGIAMMSGPAGDDGADSAGSTEVEGTDRDEAPSEEKSIEEDVGEDDKDRSGEDDHAAAHSAVPPESAPVMATAAPARKLTAAPGKPAARPVGARAKPKPKPPATRTSDPATAAPKKRLRLDDDTIPPEL